MLFRSQMGPHRDVVGEWQKAARKYGLKFGVSEHLGASFTWFQPSHGADKEGPKAGVPYDGANPEFQDLYHFPAEPGDTGWYSKNPRWHKQWFEEISELVDSYQPDLLYSDGGVAFGNEVGLALIARLYNASAARNGGKAEAVYNCKQKSEGRWVEDLERGIMPKIEPYPWQTDTSIGDWFYNKNWKLRPVSWVIHMLVDNVSKNGNLLLNVVQRPDGSLDPEVEQMLEELAQWTAVHGEAIFGTRPWLVYGESAVKVRGGAFKEDFAYNAREIRFTTKGPALYAVALGWPEDGKLVVRSLAKTEDKDANRIERVELLGCDDKAEWAQTAEGLVVTVPQKKVSSYTCALRIAGSNWKPVKLAAPAALVKPDAAGKLTLRAGDAELQGDLKVEEKGGGENIGFWDSGADSASWSVQFDRAGTYQVSLSAATVHGGAAAAIEAGGPALTVKVPSTGDYARFQNVSAGRLTIDKPGARKVTVRAADPGAWKAINLRMIQLTPTKD